MCPTGNLVGVVLNTTWFIQTKPPATTVLVEERKITVYLTDTVVMSLNQSIHYELKGTRC